MVFLINFQTHYRSDQKINAQAKAPTDVTRTLTSLGIKELRLLKYNPLLWNGEKLPKWKGYFRRAIDFMDKTLKLYQIHTGDKVFFQYHSPTDHLLKAVRKARKRGAIIIFIIHDLQSLRFNKKQAKELMMLNLADLLYIHTENMDTYLKGIGCISQTRIMHLFDYYSNDPMPPTYQEEREVVVFAGNLEKSLFLPIVDSSPSALGYKLRLYGKLDRLTFMHPDIEYRGSFSAEHTGVVQGGWGLLWDGDSIETCKGEMGNYLRYNSSHKISLYLVQGMPLILWKESSLAKWASNEGIAVLVSSLEDIPNSIRISEDKYYNLAKNARRVGLLLRKGAFLQQLVLSDC